MDADRPGIPPKAWLLPIGLLTLGTLLTGSYLVILLSDVSQETKTIGIIINPFGSVSLAIGGVIAWQVGKLHRLARSGVTARATVTSIDTTRKVVNGRRELRIGMSVTVGELPKYQVTVRDSPPSHLVSLLHPGASIPVVAVPDAPKLVLIDWKTAEREIGPDRPE
ncbi:hypothetical protein JOF56_005759 [Kibdelosporangium banguiense]|uniref:DUF3093 domain-containing protein n=1 Tax=Kibdelosporangium banguiense TaxID=1365924 RepID=A0ABS4TN07_9PSEU|nr:hypothetical protein [Kibdelosporangium banguiense]MBP2325374.1 hypothetical protein [Kibdelosporangium banguiense]